MGGRLANKESYTRIIEQNTTDTVAWRGAGRVGDEREETRRNKGGRVFETGTELLSHRIRLNAHGTLPVGLLRNDIMLKRINSF